MEKIKIKSYKEDFTIKLGNLSETIITYKFKDPRDALNYLVKHIRALPRQIIESLFKYIEKEGFCNQLFNPLEMYYYIIISFQIDCKVGVVRHWFNILNEFSTMDEIENLYKCLEDEIKLLNVVNRESHKFAVANTWGIWNESNIIKKGFNEINNLKFKVDATKLFNEAYEGKKIKKVFDFHLSRRIWKIVFIDDSWILAEDHGNSWFYPLTNFNSYILLEPYRY